MRKIRGTNWEAEDTEKLRRKALDICESARAQLILKHPFVGRLGVHIPFIPVMDSRVRTIATNGKVIYIRPEWLCRMPPVTAVACIAHTIWTAALCHSFRRGGTDPVRFDLASDLEVYTLLKTEKVTMIFKPEFADIFPKHLPVEEIVLKLPELKLLRHPDADVHLYTAGIISLPPLPEEDERKDAKEELPENEQGMSGSESQRGKGKGRKQKSGTEENEDADGPTASGSDADSSPEAQEYDGEVDTSCDPAMREVWRQRIIEAGQHYKMTYGLLPGELAELVQSFQTGKIDYLQLLRRYLSRMCGGESHWLPPARRFVWQGMYLPSRTHAKIDIVVAVDTSGSIDEAQFQQIFGEIVSIVRGFPNYRLILIQCDAEIQSVEEYSVNNPFDPEMRVQIRGRGGTDFRPVFEYLKQKELSPNALLYYTDGVGLFPVKEPKYPVIWLLQNGSEGDIRKEDIPWGKVIEIK